MSALHGVMAKAVPTVVKSAAGVAAYQVARKAVQKVPLRSATVTMIAWGLRVAREAERKAGESSERARLTAADVLAEAKERAGDDVAPAVVHAVADNDN